MTRIQNKETSANNLKTEVDGFCMFKLFGQWYYFRVLDTC